jgi:hypothetical protein
MIHRQDVLTDVNINAHVPPVDSANAKISAHKGLPLEKPPSYQARVRAVGDFRRGP